MTRSRDVSKGATRNEFIYTATATQTTFSGNDDNSNSLSYTVGQIDVFMNGARLAPADFTATNGTSVVLDSGAAASDIIQINAFGTFSVSDVVVARAEFDYTATAGQTTFSGNDNDSQSLTYTAGRIDVYLNGSRLNVTDDYVATNGTSVVLQSGAQAGDSLVVVSHGTVNLVSNILDTTLDLNGEKLVLDADADTSIHASTDDQIDIEIAGADDFAFKANKFEVQTGSNIDMNGTELILDADGDTSITADTDDRIDFKIAGADDFKMTANNFNVLSGSTLTIDSGATITNSGTANGFGGTVVQVEADEVTAEVTGSGTYSDLGLSVNITPTSASNHILLLCTGSIGLNTAAAFKFLEGSTAVGIGDTPASNTNRVRASFKVKANDLNSSENFAASCIINSPGTSEVTYKVQVEADSDGTWALNRSFNLSNSDDSIHSVTSSYLYAIELDADTTDIDT